MKALFISGSPRKDGNTEIAIRSLFEQVQDKVPAEMLTVRTMTLSPCIACDYCKSHGECFKSDDTRKAVELVKEADFIVLGTPVYWWGMSSQLKMILDKFYSCTEDFQQMKKKLGLIVIGANETSDEQYRLIDDQMRCITSYLGWQYSFFRAYSFWEKGVISMDERSMAEIRTLANLIVE